MPTKALTLPADDITEADVAEALRILDDRVAVLKKEMAVRDKDYERRRKSAAETLARIEKLLAR